ncbi:MAG: hypothetical protein DRP89_01315 [Candidatus Neomarinimicrobiota bacterium]|nr:MAG: hypothetical protein DRP89_01315 [Candidatus Neomarinimicrobiota bacterium]
MLTFSEFVIYLCIGLVSGFMSGMFGIGGGSVRIPLLNLAGLPLISAFGINLFVIPFSSFVGALKHRENINKNIGVYMIVGGALGSIAGAISVGLIPNLALAIIFAIIAILTVFGIYLDKIDPRISQALDPTPRDFILIPFFLNLITGMRGGSGGSLFPPFLKAMKQDVHKAIATSLFVTIFTSLAAMVIYWHRGNIVWLPALCVLIGSIAGARIGSGISIKAKPFWLEIGLVVLVMVLAFSVIYKALCIRN